MQDEVFQLKVYLQILGIMLLILIAAVSVIFAMTYGMQWHRHETGMGVWNGLEKASGGG